MNTAHRHQRARAAASTVEQRPDTWPRWITAADSSRCYVLFDDVECNIARWGRVGECGAWNWARGLLVELHRRLGGSPLSLHYRDLRTRGPHDAPDDPEHLPVGIEVTARLRDRDGHDITVVSRCESAPYGPRGDVWQMTVNGAAPDADSELTRPPPLPQQARMAYLHLSSEATRPLAPVIPLRGQRP